MPPEPAAPPGLARASFPAMGTEVTVLAPGGRADEAAGRARRLFEDWERRLSRFRPDSELARLNAHAGRPVPVGGLLYQVLETALAAARAAGGVYDPTTGRQLAMTAPSSVSRRGRRAGSRWGRAAAGARSGWTRRPGWSRSRPGSASTSAASPRAWPWTRPSSAWARPGSGR